MTPAGARCFMLELTGPVVLSDAKRRDLLARVQRDNAEVSDLSAEYVHFVAGEVSAAERDVLDRLLEYGPKHPRRELSGTAVLVVPRVGTISPWSSKATDIAHICGLTHVKRIERGIRYVVAGSIGAAQALAACLHDRMTETLLSEASAPAAMFATAQPTPLRTIEVSSSGRAAIEAADRELGLALTADEIDYLVDSFRAMGRDPHDIELMMFAQANSEHCRHKIFNAAWIVDGEKQERSLFDMIRRTTEASPDGVLSAYSDNSAVIEGSPAGRFFPDPATAVYGAVVERADILMKVETHNHPTAISPFAGAATGSGGEIRDEGATGRGAKPKAGLTGFSVSNLRLPDALQPWEQHDYGKPARIASALDIMLDGPLGGAAFNNEFGRPNLAGYFRTFELAVVGANGREVRGYHKPIMLAGGYGNIRPQHVMKRRFAPGTPIVVLGGPAMLIGLGGGAASSMASGASTEDLDFASVQRHNPEIQRRCQEVIDRCWALGNDNPVVSIHDVGAGGLSNALPELVHDSKRGAHFHLRNVPNDEPSMSPLEIWCNEAQERYVLAIDRDQLARFRALCERERCPYAVVGEATDDGRVVLDDSHFNNRPIDMPLDVLLGKTPKTLRDVERVACTQPALTLDLSLREAALRVLQLPTVADKTFLITIGDRTITGLVARDQMVGPWQVPVADAAVTTSSFDTVCGEAMAMGERTPVALLDAPASVRLAVGEAITNIASAKIDGLSKVKLSANWMAAAGHAGEDARLYDAVRAVGMELCPALGISIPVGKDSMSMRTVWEDHGEQRSVTSPLSLVVTAFAPTTDVRRALTPQLQLEDGDTELLLIDLGRGKNRLGASALAQVTSQLGQTPADLDDPNDLVRLFDAVRQLNDDNLLLAYHDRSDGGLFTTVVEMAFAGGAGVDLNLDAMVGGAIEILFNEELGVVLQIRCADQERVLRILGDRKLGDCTHVVGRPTKGAAIRIEHQGTVLLDETRHALRAAWSSTTHRMQALRDDATCADEEQQARLDPDDPGLTTVVSFEMKGTASFRRRPRIAILREQGVNGQIEMAAAFDRAGFEAVDVHMSDIVQQRRSLAEFAGLVACGGFSYGDVLGAGEGWAKSILFNPHARSEFTAFFARSDSFALGVCNGCQMLSNLSELIPGAEAWPRFVRNRSEQFEARLSTVEIVESPSILLTGMAGSRLPIAVAHGEGRAELAPGQLATLTKSQAVAARFVDNYGRVSERYPSNPNGSPGGITALTTPDGRVTIMMPHPERVFRTVQLSYRPAAWGEDSPWMRLFHNARTWLG